MRDKKFVNSFIPQGCKEAIPGTVITVGSGSQWGDVSSTVNARDLMIVAGAAKTVSVGGFLSNGGHGPLSAKYGLGADMVAEIELVTAAGELIKANECQNQDYFWAMRGVGITFDYMSTFATTNHSHREEAQPTVLQFRTPFKQFPQFQQLDGLDVSQPGINSSICTLSGLNSPPWVSRDI